ncbi:MULTISPECIES: hypothetical protein [Bradyrhizobium]|nr:MULTISPECIES: hypothetical protein [Bradyrhizobium]
MIERKLFEAITDDILRKLEDRTSILIFPESKAACCPVEEKVRQ